MAIPISPRIKLESSLHSRFVDATKYQQLSGSILYLTIFRLDITHVVNLMTRFMHKPYVKHIDVAKKILRYIAIIKDLALKFTKLPLFVLLGFSNSNYGDDIDDRKSTFAYVFNIGFGVISWYSKKQPTITLSTIKIEYRAMIVVAQEAIWLRHILNKIKFGQVGPSHISSDNKSTITLAKNPMFHKRIKHMKIQAHFIKDKVLNGTLQL